MLIIINLIYCRFPLIIGFIKQYMDDFHCALFWTYQVIFMNIPCFFLNCLNFYSINSYFDTLLQYLGESLHIIYVRCQEITINKAMPSDNPPFSNNKTLYYSGKEQSKDYFHSIIYFSSLEHLKNSLMHFSNLLDISKH